MAIENFNIETDEKFSFVKSKEIAKRRLIIGAVCTAASLVTLLTSAMLIFKILLPVAVAAISAICVISAAREGFVIGHDGKIKITSGFGTESIALSELKRIAVNFKEWENGEFTAQVKFVFSEGDVFLKDYGAKFENTANHLFLSSYTMPTQDMEAVRGTLEKMNICNITVIDINQDIIYQYIKK
jgi:hypothetical protein